MRGIENATIASGRSAEERAADAAAKEAAAEAAAQALRAMSVAQRRRFLRKQKREAKAARKAKAALAQRSKANNVDGAALRPDASWTSVHLAAHRGRAAVLRALGALLCTPEAGCSSRSVRARPQAPP